MKKLDEKDQLLLSLLKKNSRSSLVNLAKQIGLSRSATHDRITRLEESDIIKAYTVELDDRIELKTRAIFIISFLAGFQNQLLAKKIADINQVSSTHCLTGDIDLLAHVACEDANQLADIRQQISNFDGIKEIRTHSVIDNYQ